MTREEILEDFFDRAREALVGADLDDFECCQDVAYSVKLIAGETELELANLEHEQRKENS